MIEVRLAVFRLDRDRWWDSQDLHVVGGAIFMYVIHGQGIEIRFFNIDQ